MARRFLVPGLLLSLVAGSFAYRLWLALNIPGHLGVDGGAYLISRNGALGVAWPADMFMRPPLAPGWLLVPFTAIWGDLVGFKVWSAVFYTLPTVPLFLLARRLVPVIPSLLVTFFYVVDPLTSELLVTGVLPLVGLSALLLAVWAVLGIYQNGSRWPLVALLVLAPVWAAYTNQTSAGLYALNMALLWGLLWLWRSTQAERNRLRSIGWASLLGIVLAATALPFYRNVLPFGFSAEGTRLTQFPGSLVGMQDFPWDASWLQLFIAVPVVALCLLKGTRIVRVLAVLLAVNAGLHIWLSTNEAVMNILYRASYVQMMLLYPLVGWLWIHRAEWWPQRLWAAPLRPTRWVNAAALVPLSVFWLGGVEDQTYRQSYYSSYVSADMGMALARMKDGGGGPVITSTASLAMWTYGLNREPRAYWTNAWTPPIDLQDWDVDTRCILGWLPGCDVSAAVQRLGVRYVLVDTRWPLAGIRFPEYHWRIYGAPPQPYLWDITASAPWLELQLARGTTRLWAVEPRAFRYHEWEPPYWATTARLGSLEPAAQGLLVPSEAVLTEVHPDYAVHYIDAGKRVGDPGAHSYILFTLPTKALPLGTQLYWQEYPGQAVTTVWALSVRTPTPLQKVSLS